MKLKLLYPALLSFYNFKSSFAGPLTSTTDGSSQIQSTGGGEEKHDRNAENSENGEKHLWELGPFKKERSSEKENGESREKHLWELDELKKEQSSETEKVSKTHKKTNSFEPNEKIANILFDDKKQFSLDDYKVESDGKQWCNCRKQFNVDDKKLDEMRDDMFRQIRKSVFDSIISGTMPLHIKYIELLAEADTVPLEILEKMIQMKKQRIDFLSKKKEKCEEDKNSVSNGGDGILIADANNIYSESIIQMKPNIKPKKKEGWFEKIKIKMVGVCMAISLMALAFFTMNTKNSGQNRLSRNQYDNCKNHHNSQESIVPISEYNDDDDDDDHDKYIYDKCPDGNQKRGPCNYELGNIAINGINEQPILESSFFNVEGNQHINSLPQAACHTLYGCNVVLPDKGLRKSVLNSGVNTDNNCTSCSDSMYTVNDDEKYMKDTDIRGSRASMAPVAMINSQL